MCVAGGGGACVGACVYVCASRLRHDWVPHDCISAGVFVE